MSTPYDVLMSCLSGEPNRRCTDEERANLDRLHNALFKRNPLDLIKSLTPKARKKLRKDWNALELDARCRKKAPFVCPECKSIDCQIDHWDMPGFGLCCHCGKRNCPKNTATEHRPQCKRKKDHKGKCKG